MTPLLNNKKNTNRQQCLKKHYKQVSQFKQDEQDKQFRQDEQDKQDKQDKQDRQNKHDKQDKQDKLDKQNKQDKLDKQDKHELKIGPNPSSSSAQNRSKSLLLFLLLLSKNLSKIVSFWGFILGPKMLILHERSSLFWKIRQPPMGDAGVPIPSPDLSLAW